MRFFRRQATGAGAAPEIGLPDLQMAVADVAAARNRFDVLSSLSLPEEIDAAILELRVAELRLNAVVKQAKMKGGDRVAS